MIRGRLALLLLSTVVSLSVVGLGYEIVARVSYERWKAGFDNHGFLERLTVPSTNPVLMWEYRPYGKFGDIETNRYGFRERDLPVVAPRKGVERVAVVGDSVTLGMGIAAQDSFVRRLEALLNPPEGALEVEVLNFGVDGYNAVQIRELLQTRVIPFEPDVVLYAMSLNDFDFEESAGLKTRYFRRPGSFLLDAIRRALRRPSGEEFHAYHFRRNRDVVLREILEMRSLARQGGGSFAVALLPVFPYGATGFDHYPQKPLHDAITARLRGVGIPVRDGLPAFLAEGGSAERFAYDLWHPNAEGHRLIAEQLAPFVERVLPGDPSPR